MGGLFQPTTIPILFVSARNRMDDLLHGFSVGANDYLTKPFEQMDLLLRIQIHKKIALLSFLIHLI